MGGIETKTKASNDDWVVNIGVRMGAACLARKGPRGNWRTVKSVRTGGLMANGRGLFPHLLTTEQQGQTGTEVWMVPEWTENDWSAGQVAEARCGLACPGRAGPSGSGAREPMRGRDRLPGRSPLSSRQAPRGGFRLGKPCCFVLDEEAWNWLREESG